MACNGPRKVLSFLRFLLQCRITRGSSSNLSFNSLHPQTRSPMECQLDFLCRCSRLHSSTIIWGSSLQIYCRMFSGLVCQWDLRQTTIRYWFKCSSEARRKGKRTNRQSKLCMALVTRDPFRFPTLIFVTGQQSCSQSLERLLSRSQASYRQFGLPAGGCICQNGQKAFALYAPSAIPSKVKRFESHRIVIARHSASSSPIHQKRTHFAKTFHILYFQASRTIQATYHQ